MKACRAKTSLKPYHFPTNCRCVRLSKWGQWFEIVLPRYAARSADTAPPTGKNKQRKIGNAYRLGLSSMALLEIQFVGELKSNRALPTLFKFNTALTTSSPDRVVRLSTFRPKPYISTCFVLGSINQPNRHSRIFPGASSESLLERNSTRSQEIGETSCCWLSGHSLPPLITHPGSIGDRTAPLGR